MVRRVALGVVFLLALVSASVASADAPDPHEGAPLVVVASKPFDGELLLAAAVGDEVVSANEPVCRTNVPPAATLARVELWWNVTVAPAVRLHLTAFDESPLEDASSTVLGAQLGESPLRLEVPVSSVEELWLRVTAADGATVRQPFQGEVVLLAPAPDPHDSTAVETTAASAPGPEPDARPVIALAGAGLLGATFLIHRWLRRLFWLVPSYHRIARERVLDHPTRRRIHALVVAQPGIHPEALIQSLGTGRGNVEHHVHKLIDAGLVVEEVQNGYRCLFVRGAVGFADREAAGLMKSAGAQKVLRAIREEPGSSTREVARRSGLAVATVAYHVRRLSAGGLVTADREAGGRGLVVTDRGSRWVQHKSVRQPSTGRIVGD